MKERPILFSAPMVRALLSGTKTQTRRAFSARMIKLMSAAASLGEVSRFMEEGALRGYDLPYIQQFSPYGQPGDRLWVREAHAIVPRTAYAHSDGVPQTLRPNDDHDAAIYREGWTRSRGGFSWRPSIHMPRWASRIDLEITAVRVERLQDISEADAVAEGTTPSIVGADLDHLRFRAGYQTLWESLNGTGSWAVNPWVWVVEFKRVAA